jgi:hypothetical protein
MGEAARRKEAERIGRHMASPEVRESTIKGKPADVCAAAAAYLLESSVDRTLLFGPVVWLPSDGTSARQWYFMVTGCEPSGETFSDRINAQTEDMAVEMREGIKMALVLLRPAVMFDFDDELEAIRWAEAAWPGGKITRIRKAIETERAAL